MKKMRKTPKADPMDIFRDKDGQFESGKGMGMHMSAMKPYVDYVLGNLVKDARLVNPELALPFDGRPVVIIASHGPGIAWVPLVALVGKAYRDHGCEDMIGGMFPHPAVFWVPGLRKKYEKVLGTPTSITSVEGMVDLLERKVFAVTGTAPEGANCLVSFDEYVTPFRSGGMVAAAILSGAAICLAAHKGAEEWNLRLNLPFGWKIPYTGGLRGVNVALPPYKKLDSYVAMCRRYEPIASREEMANADKRRRRLLLHVEMERIRAELNLMTDNVADMMKENARTEVYRPTRPVSGPVIDTMDDPTAWTALDNQGEFDRGRLADESYMRVPWLPGENRDFRH